MSNQALPAGLSVYLINLDRAVDRLARMTAKCDAVGLPFERVPAVDGSMPGAIAICTAAG